MTDEVEDKNSIKSLFIDSIEYSFENGFIRLPENLVEGRHYIKLQNSWDFSEVYFNVEKSEKAEKALFSAGVYGNIN